MCGHVHEDDLIIEKTSFMIQAPRNIIEDIRGEIQEYEEKCGDTATAHIAFDNVIRMLTRKITSEKVIAEYKRRL